MFRRKNTGLPVAGSQHGPDGSGRAIHMDAPLWRAWKNADSFIKGSYMFLLLSFLLMFGGYRHLRYHNASIWLTCHTEVCTLQITPPGRKGTVEVEFARKQLLEAQPVKVNKHGVFVKIDDSKDPIPIYRDHKRKKKKVIDNRTGPDADGNYDSYQLVLKPGKSTEDDGDDEKKESQEGDDDNVEENDLSGLTKYARVDDEGRVTVLMRRFNMGQTRRRTRTMVAKVDAYVKQRRHKLTLKENASLPWQGIVALVLGLFLMLLTILIGQFVEESRPKQGGPGARRYRASNQSPKQSSLKYGGGAVARKRY